MSAAEPRWAFSEAVLRFGELVHAFTADNLRLERIVLRTKAEQGAIADTFSTPEQTVGHQEVWRVKFLLLDIVYGEPSSAITRITTDLTGDRGRLRPAWDLALRIREGAYGFPTSDVDHAHRAVSEYGLELFRPNMAKCRALWNSLPAEERARLSPDVTDVMAAVSERLNAMESAFSALEHGSWVLQTSAHAARV
ncbi:hypothetical protein ACFYM0_02770 [Streptomyces sp. NPDC006487]|uniref:hypothetical protein n=1 Tax=Streptomyces sp. NPDC006487 TaxID=3364748 RepID=UPI0036818365